MTTLIPQNSVTFSPNGGTLAALTALLATANAYVDVALYELTDPTLTASLTTAAKRGIHVRAILDAREARSHHSYCAEAATGGVTVRLCDHYHIMHHKVALIDGTTLVTGSFNWSVDAEQHNAENCVALFDQPKLYQAFHNNFEHLWAISKPLDTPLRPFAAPAPIATTPAPATLPPAGQGSPSPDAGARSGAGAETSPPTKATPLPAPVFSKPD